MASDGAVEAVLQAKDEPAADDEPQPRKWRTPGFQRMRLDWTTEDNAVLYRAKAMSDGRLAKEFEDCYRVLYRIYDVVRTPLTDKGGEVQKDQFGLPVWKRSQLGGFEEDFTRLTNKEKTDFLFALTTHLFEWQQIAADAWGESMLAKAQWEERFSLGFEAPTSGTVEDRTAHGRLDSRDERYFAIFLSMYSRKADALVRSIELLSQRLKDSMVF
jgi:hypothetical protein